MPNAKEQARIGVTLSRSWLPAADPFESFLTLRSQLGESEVFLLESLAGPVADRRSAVVGFFPLLTISVTSGGVRLEGLPILTRVMTETLVEAGCVVSAENGLRLATRDAFWDLQRVLNSAFEVSEATNTSFTFGFLAFYGYDTVHYIERLQRTIPEREDGLPDAVFRVYQGTAEFHLESSETQLVLANSALWDDRSAEEIANLLAPTGPASSTLPPVSSPLSIVDSTTQEQFLVDTEKCLHHIKIGDIYQVQLGHELTIESAVDPITVYRRLRARNPSPYMCYLPLPQVTVIGGSPENFVRIEGRTMTTRPIAGTTPRTGDVDEDRARVAALQENEKEIAEHVMLVDLGRNDLSRVAETGTLDVTEMLVVEDFSHVFHLVSNVTAEMAEDVDVYDVIRSMFPAGTVSGAPKIRAMEIIEDIETTRRGWYAGAFGLIGSGGYVNLGLCIRTVFHAHHLYRTRASAGIVADSTPASEWRETLAKLSATYWAVTGEELL